jgi:predicted nucleic acid-binding protein
MADLWVVNASPLITLSKVGQLELLQAGNRRLVIPEAVRAEVLRGPADDPARKALESDFQAVSYDEAPEPMVLEWGLGNGETAVLSFAKKNDAIAVLDDRTARMAAKVMGIQIVGTLGVVLRAHRTGRIRSAAVVIRTLRDAGLRLEDDLIRKALAQTTGEKWSE